MEKRKKRSKHIFTKNKTKTNNPCVKSCANIRLSLVTWNISDLTSNYDWKVQFSTNNSIFFCLDLSAYKSEESYWKENKSNKKKKSRHKRKWYSFFIYDSKYSEIFVDKFMKNYICKKIINCYLQERLP